MPTFPFLYKKTSTGAIQTWKISVFGQRIVTDFGQLNSSNMQQTEDLISEGKNIGKQNETSANEQAMVEAKAKWESQKKKGYVESIEDARDGKVDALLIQGGISPMLAHKFQDHAHKIKYPAFVQPKLDGGRCIAIVTNGKCTLWSRTRKPINSMPHVVEALEKKFPKAHITLDGELYNHEYKDRFEEIVSIIRQQNQIHPDHTKVQYHIYDMGICDTRWHYENRLSYLQVNFADDTDFLKLVPTHEIESEENVTEWLEQFLAQGYEGAIVRNALGFYENKRSYNLLKVKTFDDAEFKIIGCEQGRGKLIGHVGAFVCITDAGKDFFVKMSGETEKLKEYFENPAMWAGKMLTVKYQGITNANGVPRFPIGIRIREPE